MNPTNKTSVVFPHVQIRWMRPEEFRFDEKQRARFKEIRESMKTGVDPHSSKAHNTCATSRIDLNDADLGDIDPKYLAG